MDCEHEWRWQAIVHSLGGQLPGSGACERVYEDRYYCARCLEIRDKNRRVSGNSYRHPLEGSIPK
jgi:hypothetical protein